MKSLIDILIPNFQSSYKPSRDIAVDDQAMVDNIVVTELWKCAVKCIVEFLYMNYPSR